MANPKFSFREEFKLVPRVMIGVAFLGFLAAQFFFNVWVIHHHRHELPPTPARVFLGILVGCAFAVYIMLIGYVFRDSKRRGMNRVLWVLLVMFIPNALGFVLYFLLRNPPEVNCPQCGTTIESGFNYCPKCRFMLASTCQCGRSLQPGFACCPYCGRPVQQTA